MQLKRYIGHLIFILLVTSLIAGEGFVTKQIGKIKSGKIKEASGMAYSRRNKDRLWIINDSGAKADIHALTLTGKRLGRFRISGIHNRDWEDLAAFRKDDISYLLIGDIGDNDAVHSQCQLILIQEPDIALLSESKKQKIEALVRVSFVYENGPRDCEAMAVDEQRGIIYLVSKREYPPVLYELPLIFTTPKATLTAKRVTTVPGIPKPTLQDLREDTRYGAHCNQPTAMDIDENRLVILTYKRLFIYTRKSNDDWASVLGKVQPIAFQFPHLKQAESLCIQPDTGSMLITSEGKHPPILEITIPH